MAKSSLVWLFPNHDQQACWIVSELLQGKNWVIRHFQPPVFPPWDRTYLQADSFTTDPYNAPFPHGGAPIFGERSRPISLYASQFGWWGGGAITPQKYFGNHSPKTYLLGKTDIKIIKIRCFSPTLFQLSNRVSKIPRLELKELDSLEKHQFSSVQ